MKSRILSLAAGLIASVPLFLSSCQDEEFGYTPEQIAYRTNFEKKFGKIKDIPTFDLSSYNLNRLGLEGGPTFIGKTRAASPTTARPIVGRWFNVPSGIADWLDTELKEERDNRENGTKDFVLRMPDDHDIMIIPIYQGKAGLNWNLCIKDENTGFAETLWEKSDGIQISSEGSVNYTNNTVGASKTITFNGSSLQNNGKNYYYSLKSALNEMGYNPSQHWFKLTASGFNTSTDNGSITSNGAEGDNIGTVSFNNGSATFEVKNESVLNGGNISVTTWWPKASEISHTGDISLTLQLYQKNSSSSWNDLNDKTVNGNTIGKTIRSQALLVDHTKFSGYFSLYLDILNLDVNYRTDPVRTYRQDFASREIQSSTQGMMLALTDLTKDPEFVKSVLDELRSSFWSETANIMFLGCEDSDLPKGDGVPGSDWDMNDVVFLIVGMSADNVRPKYEELIRKRYMIEDLGGTFDFDFNDIVIDVEQIRDLRDNSVTQKATLKHLCGTIPWKVKIGNTEFSQLPGRNGDCGEGGDGYDPATAEDNAYASIINANISGWDPDLNNIVMTTWPSAAGTDGWTDHNQTEKFLAEADGIEYTFPKEKEYPYIIACDPTVDWQKELITIDDDWFTVWKRDVVVSPNKLALQQSIVYVVKGVDNSQRTIEYSTNSPALVNVACVGSHDGLTWSVDRENQTITFTADQNAVNSTYNFVVSQSSTTYYESKSVNLVVKVLNEALQINDFNVSPDFISIQNGSSTVISYSGNGTGAVSVDEADYITTTINAESKQITISVSDNAPLGTEITLHVRQSEDNTYYDADKPVIVKVRGQIVTLDEGNVAVWNNGPMEIDWQNGNSSGKKGLLLGDKNDGQMQVYNDFDLSTHVGEKLVVKTSCSDYDNATYAIRDMSWNNHQADATLPGDFYVTITQNMVNNGILFTGKGYTINSISLICEHSQEPEEPETGGTIDYNITGLGTEFTRTFTQKDYNGTKYYQISLQDAIGTYNGTDDIIVNFVMPANSSLTGKFGGTAPGWFQQEEEYTISNPNSEPAVIAVKLSELTGNVANKYKNADGNIVFDIYSTTSCTVDRNKAASVRIFVAKEAVATYTITGATNNASYGSVTVSNVSVISGGSVTLTANSTSGYRFVKWQDDDTSNPRTITNVTADATYTATFEAIPTYVLTLNVEGQGTVTGARQYEEGATATISANASIGYRFVGWRDENGNMSTSDFVTMNGNRTLTAVFEEYTGPDYGTKYAGTIAADGFIINYDPYLKNASNKVTITFVFNNNFNTYGAFYTGTGYDNQKSLNANDYSNNGGTVVLDIDKTENASMFNALNNGLIWRSNGGSVPNEVWIKCE